MLEQRITCPKCGTRHEEWDPEEGGDIHAYYPEEYVDFGCKIIEDKYDALRENSKTADGKPGKLNGVRVRLVPKEDYLRNLARRRKKREARKNKQEESAKTDTNSSTTSAPFSVFHP